MEELEQLKHQLLTQRPVEWAQLPDIPLYMDQVVSYLKRQTVSLSDESGTVMTSAMINNYIKDGMVPRAKGKRYGREHLCDLTAIALLKNVLSVRDMKLLLDHLTREGAEQTFYEDLLGRIDTGFTAAADAIDPSISEADLAAHALDLAIASCAAKLSCEALLAVMRSREPEETKK
jgi:hypothetical protein